MEFPSTLVINLDKRVDRWNEIQRMFGEWPSLERVSAVEETPGWKGCAKSHIKSINLAKQRLLFQNL
jgi:GR25 family glycosyltransferase involved in LPS biosynthesis